MAGYALDIDPSSFERLANWIDKNADKVDLLRDKVRGLKEDLRQVSQSGAIVRGGGGASSADTTTLGGRPLSMVRSGAGGGDPWAEAERREKEAEKAAVLSGYGSDEYRAARYREIQADKKREAADRVLNGSGKDAGSGLRFVVEVVIHQLTGQCQRRALIDVKAAWWRQVITHRPGTATNTEWRHQLVEE
ncbi:hypothetical protein EON81_22150, partial [bacterium]